MKIYDWVAIRLVLKSKDLIDYFFLIAIDVGICDFYDSSIEAELLIGIDDFLQ